jgi:hypothetical protein
VPRLPPRRRPGYTLPVSRKTGRSRPRRQTLHDELPADRRGRSAAPGPRRRPAAARAVDRQPMPWLQPRTMAKWLIWGAATFAFFYYTAVGIERQITWYLAVDQFGYLTFAHDLLRGRVFHEWGPMKALEPFFPARTDVLAQTYVYDGGLLYCRYSPGFPILLAGWIGLLGDDRAHYFNPTVYLVLLAVALAFQWRLFRSPWRAAAGTALIALFPTMMHLWGLTLTRDLSAHLFAFTGLFLLLPANGRPLGPWRLLAAGLALGFTIAIRPDAVLYLVPAACMLAVRCWHERRRHSPGGLALATLALGAGLLAGASPILAYNWAATGNPLLPTQGMELPLLPALPPPKAKPQPPTPPPPADAPPADADAKVGYPSRGWRGGTFEAVQGGGLRLTNLATTLPGNWRLILSAYTPLLFGVAVWGAVVATVMRPMLAVAAVSYGVTAFLFFSCWPRPDLRYLIGVFVFLPMLIVEGTMGTLDLVRLLWKRRQQELARGLATFAPVVFILGALVLPPRPGSAVPMSLFLVVTLTAGVAAALAAIMPGRRIVALAAPVLMLGLVWCKVSDVDAEAGRRAPFQRAQMLEARANMQKLLEPNAVVITTEEVGRPAENIEYYSGVADALYVTDLERWRASPRDAALHLITGGKRPYLFIPADQPGKERLLADLRTQLTVDLVADITPQRAMAHFVAAPFHRGVRMELYRMSSPVLEDAMRKRRAAPTLAP